MAKLLILSILPRTFYHSSIHEMNAHPLIQYCFVRDLTAQYKQDYLALENAYLIQIAE